MYGRIVHFWSSSDQHSLQVIIPMTFGKLQMLGFGFCLLHSVRAVMLVWRWHFRDVNPRCNRSLQFLNHDPWLFYGPPPIFLTIPGENSFSFIFLCIANNCENHSISRANNIFPWIFTFKRAGNFTEVIHSKVPSTKAQRQGPSWVSNPPPLSYTQSFQMNIQHF